MFQLGTQYRNLLPQHHFTDIIGMRNIFIEIVYIVKMYKFSIMFLNLNEYHCLLSSFVLTWKSMHVFIFSN